MAEHNKTHLLLDKEGEENYTSTVTEDIWLYDINERGIRNNFAEPTHKNSVKAYVQGYDYFQDLIADIRSAEKEIYITGWQVNWDAMLTPNLRLVDLLLEVVQKNAELKIFILPWKSQSVAVDTNDQDTRNVLRNYINEYIGREVIFVRLHDSKNDEPYWSYATQMFFSHHQKCIIIDRKKAYVGGIDLAYGRYCHGYNLDPKADNRQVLNRYNPCVRLMGDNKKEISLSFKPRDHSTIKQNTFWQSQIFDKKHFDATQTTLADNQPIMPWQDVHVKIEGKAVFDLTLNFVLRWNQADSPNSEYKRNNVSDYCIHKSLSLPTQQEYDGIVDKGNISVQILRSAPAYMRNWEAMSAILSKDVDLNNGVEGLNKLAPNVRLNTNTTSKPQSDIYQVMQKLINKAKRYIYLENQFFISDYGRPSHASLNDALSEAAKIETPIKPWITKFLSITANDLPENKIVQALSDKIASVIFAFKPEPFHVYITLPVHPEGLLNTGSIMATIHQTMQTIVFGSDSLLNRIRKHLWVYQQLVKDKAPRKNWQKLRPTYYDNMGEDYKTIELEECDKYVTLLNLRSWIQLGDRTLTEQIYVHSKLTIVDDLYVLVGSANINDRSLLGGRDSELAALIVDNDSQTINCPERGIPIPVRKFAYELRTKIWQGLYGQGLEKAIEVPELASSVNKIRSRAKSNTDIFESVFPFIPRNYLSLEYVDDTKDENVFASIWPALNYNKLRKFDNEKLEESKSLDEEIDKYNGIFGATNQEPIANQEEALKRMYNKEYFTEKLLMPFNKIFWQNYSINDANVLKNIRGHITLVPLHWTEDENNAITYHIRLVT
ncbi:hypothetical protein J3U66_12655 [Gilliamella sp. B2969]|uniref:hypothetical protein n=1 Tax=unclassified Gilliamella TaxID=2685620 RepID=UPI00226A77A8|nr:MULTISPECIES: hypothetical protein [unclassified Gilliamella]MCX8728680.1 hypothetical protein [Gilliamella sp. B2838]MCX8731230.1 hypothetical protein [Gilliamella sp. B2969]